MRPDGGDGSNLYEPFEFHEDQTGAAAEVVVQFFMALAIPCTQTRRCPRCRLQAKGSLRSSMNAAPNGEHSHRVIATQRNVHTRKVCVRASVRGTAAPFRTALAGNETGGSLVFVPPPLRRRSAAAMFPPAVGERRQRMLGV
jgi:hypothetical protein